ncbi:iron chelate uptake ABC transporter family permease subunit [Nocardioides zeae]|uniref:Iron chelate uptake ABC transporter family permease subunit n=1 Tax=Nocardioides imazamoxiresistens TaxID=3231893 RepID=A0ABU3PVV0_9ACTN|nr:iron chelate uptake ABC transporter family permease subunit [Nocardioides zeae]MDT9593353.1 iron chelate uptake ABC transporter family permease subunit [Nocardioides zeae]
MTSVSERPSEVLTHIVTADVERVRRARRGPRRRHAIVLAVLGALATTLFAVHLLLGGYTFTAPDAFRIVFGDGIGRPTAEFILMESKLPRALTALGVGVCFGIGGAVFQTTLRNPLASPDIIGVSAGASTAAVVALLSFGLRGDAVAAAAGVGAVATALLVRWVSGGLGGYRLVLVGVGTAAALLSVMHYLFTRAAVWDVQLALRWITGSLSDADWQKVQVLAVALVVLLPLVWWSGRDLRVNELGADTATGLGVPSRRPEILMLVAVLLIGAGVAGAGPVSFLAFLSGPIARGLNRGRTSIAGAALVGGSILLAADFVGANLIGDVKMPAGIITGAVGAPFLLWLMARGASGRSPR